MSANIEPVSSVRIVITRFSSINDIEATIKEALSDSFIVEQITYSSDIFFEEEEFFYLVGFQERQIVESYDLLQAVSRLIKKKKIKEIVLIVDSDIGGKRIHFYIKSLWTFKKLKIHGMLFGKNEYEALYAIEQGEPFNKDSHKHSIKKINDRLRYQGYFSGNVVALVMRDKHTKSVTVDIDVERGKKYLINDVIFFGKSVKPTQCKGLSILESKINERFVKKLSKKAYNKALINKVTRSVKRYLSRKGFLHVDVELLEKVNHEKKNVDVTFFITLHSKKEFIFFGNNFFSNTELLDKILLFGRSAWLVPASILSAEIQKAYYEKGFWNCTVEARQRDGGCFFIIKESKRISIKHIELKGVDHIDSDFLIKKCFSSFLHVKYFDQGRLHISFNNIVSHYFRQGFWDMRILKCEYEPLDNSHCYKLVLSLQEGERYYLKSVVIKDFEDLCSKGPFAKCLHEGGSLAFDITILKEQKKWLLEYFKKQGYLHVDVNHELCRKGHSIDLIWIVTLGKLTKFGKTIVTGSQTFSIDNIMRELQYKEGDVWDRVKLKESVGRLRSLGIFDHVHLYPHNVSNALGQKDVLLTLHNDDPYEIKTRVGLARYGIAKDYFFGKGFTYRLGGSFLWKNVSNSADQLIFDFDVARSYSNLFFSYKRPWLFGAPIKTNFKLYVSRYEQPGFICSKKDLYSVKQDGFLVSFNRVYRKIDFSCNVGFEWMETSVKNDMARLANVVASAIHFDRYLLGEKIPYILLEPTVLIDRVDDKLFSRSGYMTLISVKGMFPLRRCHSTSYFIRLMAEQSFFYSVTGNVIFAARLRFGHVFHQKFKNISPIERFYLGGAHSIRSYEKDMCPPWGIICDKERNFNVDTSVKSNWLRTKGSYKKGSCLLIAPRGGKTMINVNLEGRFNVYESLWGVFFQDIGTLVCDVFNRSNVSAATGFGLRYNTILGPIRFDFAFKWCKRRAFESRFAWFLAFGNAF